MTEAPATPRLRDLLYAFLLYLIALVLFGLGVRLAQGWAATVASHGVGPPRLLVAHGRIPIGVTLAGHGLAMAGIASWYLLRRYGQRLRDLGFQFIAIPRALLIGIPAGAVAKAVLAVVALLAVALTGHSLPPAPVPGLSPGTTSASRAVVIAEICILIPIAEELFFRGFVFGVLRTRCGLVVAILVTNIWFAAMHLDSQVLGLFLFGLVLTLLYQRTRSLVAAMAAHAAFNTIAVLVTIFDVPG